MIELNNLISILILAVVQGLTEFLPVSSSGHLVIGKAILAYEGVAGDGILFEVAVHAGTLGAVVFFYRRKLAKLLRSLVGWIASGFGSKGDAEEDITFIGYLALASVPAGVAGVLLRSNVESAFNSPVLASVCLVATGLFLILSRRRTAPRSLDWKTAILIGSAQALAILPGCSRSGWTITTAMICGLEFSLAAEFSFILSLPAIFGALVLELVSGGPSLGTAAVLSLVIGAVTACATGYWALKLLVYLLKRGKFYRFSWYLVPAGGIAFVYFMFIA
jgi:undecaprenyl-diphosphatase